MTENARIARSIPSDPKRIRLKYNPITLDFVNIRYKPTKIERQ